MHKLSLFLVLAGAFVAVSQGAPVDQNAITAAASRGDWNEVQRLLTENLQQGFKFDGPLTEKDIRQLKPPENGRVFAESEVAFKSSSNINGQVEEHSNGHHITNDNGVVNEYYFQP